MNDGASSRYRVEKKLGQGGVGEVFLAHDLALNRKVALKFLAADRHDSAHKRFLREAKSAASMNSSPLKFALSQPPLPPTFSRKMARSAASTNPSRLASPGNAIVTLPGTSVVGGNPGSTSVVASGVPPSSKARFKSHVSPGVERPVVSRVKLANVPAADT